MKLINEILTLIISLLDTLLPAMGVPDEFFIQLDTGLSSFISILEGVSWFIPLNLLVMCFTVMLIIDNWSLIVRIGQFILKLIRG